MTDQDAPPQPLTAPDMDVRDLDGFMLNTDRLLASELWALATGEEFKAAVGLWCRAWKQIPAGSLPNDDRILASFAAVTPQRWTKVRKVALRGFVACDDGRLYHRVLCEDVRRAFEKKLTKRGNREGDAERKRREREDRSALFETLRSAGKAPPWNTPTSDLRIMAMAVTARVVPPVTEHDPDQVTPPVTRTVTVNTERGRDEDEDRDEDNTPAAAAAAAAPDDPRLAAAAAAGAYLTFQGIDQREAWLVEIGDLEPARVQAILAAERLPDGTRIRLPSGFAAARHAVEQRDQRRDAPPARRAQRDETGERIVRFQASMALVRDVAAAGPDALPQADDAVRAAHARLTDAATRANPAQADIDAVAAWFESWEPA